MLDNYSNLSEREQVELLSLLEAQDLDRRANLYKTTYQSFYDWQREFAASTATHHESCLCAANQIGKTYTGTEIDALHLLGDYPEDYEGHKFDFAPLCWGLGYSMEKTRDLLQSALFGKYSAAEGFEGGLIPKERIIRWESAGGTPNAMRTVWVKHELGTSLIQFWSYSQGQHAIMGDVVDWFHVDEEPRDQTIRPQLLTRTLNGDRGKGGRGIYTFTPENGRTDLVIKFMDDPSESQFFMRKGWDDAPHLTDVMKSRMLESYPAHQRDMRTKGIPMLGHGRIYDIAEEFITCKPFSIPNHWRVIDGMDFGWEHPQARVRLVFDPESQDYYVTHAWKQSQCTPDQAWGATKDWANNCPTSWPHDGLNSEKSSGEQQKKAYITAGFRLLAERATWPDGGNGVEAGIFEIRDLMSKGKFKVFEGLRAILDEILQYHRDESGKIAKKQDDALDALRYAFMMRRFAISYGELNGNEKKKIVMPRKIRTMGR